MNTFEFIKDMTIDQMAAYFCYLHECDRCPQSHHCWENHNGWFDRLSKEVTNMDRGAVGLPVPVEELEKGRL